MRNIKFYYDLHIHSVLSPDGGELMTPNNILNMAMLKELDFVAITDHNSAKQLPVIDIIEQAYDFIIIPGIEVTVQEGFDALCYFKSYQQAYDLDHFIEPYLNKDDWGPFSETDQVITDVYDIAKDTYNKALRSTSLPYNDLYQKVKELDGIIILAHVARQSKSALLHYRHTDIDFDGIEIQEYNIPSYLTEHPELKQYNILTSSDSHSLLSIAERTNYLELKEKSIDAFFAYFQGGDGDE